MAFPTRFSILTLWVASRTETTTNDQNATSGIEAMNRLQVHAKAQTLFLEVESTRAFNSNNPEYLVL